MRPKVCFTLLTFNDDYVLRECLAAVKPYGYIVACEGPVTYWQRQGYARSTDRTFDILREAEIPFISGQWREKDDMARAVSGLVPLDTEFVFQLDSDEIWPPYVLEGVLNLLAQGQTDSIAFQAVSLYGGFERYMTGFEAEYEVHRVQRWSPVARWHTHRPPTVLAPDGRPWREHRHVGAEETAARGWRYFHYSYTFPLQMQRKAAYYHDRDPGSSIERYFERVYLQWVMGDEAKKAHIESRYQGVHNFVPERRGPCFTALFDGRHPDVIKQSLPRLRGRFEAELRQVTRDSTHPVG